MSVHLNLFERAIPHDLKWFTKFYWYERVISGTLSWINSIRSLRAFSNVGLAVVRRAHQPFRVILSRTVSIYWASMGYTEFYRVFLTFTGFYRVLPGFTEHLRGWRNIFRCHGNASGHSKLGVHFLAAGQGIWEWRRCLAQFFFISFFFYLVANWFDKNETRFKCLPFIFQKKYIFFGK